MKKVWTLTVILDILFSFVGLVLFPGFAFYFYPEMEDISSNAFSMVAGVSTIVMFVGMIVITCLSLFVFKKLDFVNFFVYCFGNLFIMWTLITIANWIPKILSILLFGTYVWTWSAFISTVPATIFLVPFWIRAYFYWKELTPG